MIVLLVVSKGDKYVVLRRRNQPFIGTAEWPASDVKIGEPLNIASTRTLQERLGIIGEPKFQGFFRRIDTYKDMLFDDKIFAVHTYTLGEKDTISERGSTGKNAYYTEKQLAKIKHPSKTLLDLFSYVQQGHRRFEERIYELELKDLSLA
jgi:ADP-ribose pyrophosphatase YjhB (NUDIX family)